MRTDIARKGTRGVAEEAQLPILQSLSVRRPRFLRLYRVSAIHNIALDNNGASESPQQSEQINNGVCSTNTNYHCFISISNSRIWRPRCVPTHDPLRVFAHSFAFNTGSWLQMCSTASPTFCHRPAIASSTGSRPNSSSRSITSCTMSSESIPRSFRREALMVTSSSKKPSLVMICLTLFRVASRCTRMLSLSCPADMAHSVLDCVRDLVAQLLDAEAGKPKNGVDAVPAQARKDQKTSRIYGNYQSEEATVFQIHQELHKAQQADGYIFFLKRSVPL